MGVDERIMSAPQSDQPANHSQDEDLEQVQMTVLEHLTELRDRLIKAGLALLLGTGISVVFAKQLILFLTRPVEGRGLLAIGPTETIINYFRVALLGGATISMPVIIYELLMFVVPGLTKKERRYLWIVLPGVGISFVAGAAFAYFVMLPAAIPFLQGFLSDIVEQKWSIERYINLVTRLLFWVGLSFETPLILAFLARLGIVSPQKLVSWRRYALVIMALLAAIITPTVDPVNMLLVMAPLIVLYEIGVVLSRIAYRPRPGFSSEETE